MRRILSTILFLLNSACALADVNFVVTPNLNSNAFFVRMEITHSGESEIVRIPAWCPGFYFLLDYEKRLFDINVLNESGVKIRYKKLDSRSILIQNPSKQNLIVLYRIQGNDTGLRFFRSHLRTTSGFINGPSLFLLAESHALKPHSVQFKLPMGWDIATAMQTDGRGTFSATEYDEFVDHPIQLGRFVRKKFVVEGIPFDAIFVGDPKPNCNVDEETERLKQGSLPAIRMFGKAPFKHYIYIIHLEVGDFAGGLEHRASTVIAVANTREIRLDSLATHEYFHSWNVKQIRPKILGPFDYSKEQRTGHLWFSEGVTDYYAHLHAYQAGFYVESQLYTELGNQIEEIQYSKNRLKFTVEDASRQAWENGGFGIGDFSYYTKGSIIGLLFDAKIRAESEGEKSLDDVLRSLFDKHALPRPGFEDEELKDQITLFGGKSIPALYQSMVRSTEELPFNLLLGIGLKLVVPNETYVAPRYTLDRNGKVNNAKSSKWIEQLENGDFVVSARLLPNNDIDVTVKRGDKTIVCKTQGRSYVAGDYQLLPNPFATEKEIQRRKEWLEGSKGLIAPK